MKTIMSMRPVPPAPDPTLCNGHNQSHSISQAAAFCNQVDNVFVHFPSLSGPEGLNQSRQTRDISSSPPNLPQGCWAPG